MGLFSNFIDLLTNVAKQIGKVKVTEIIKSVITFVPVIIQDIVKIGGSNIEEKIDAGCDEIKRLTGTEPTAFDLIRDLPADKENELFDHAAEIIRILAKNQAKIAGYYIPGAPAEDTGIISSLYQRLDEAFLNPPEPAQAAEPGKPGAVAASLAEDDQEAAVKAVLADRERLRKQLASPSTFTAVDRINAAQVAIANLIDYFLIGR